MAAPESSEITYYELTKRIRGDSFSERTNNITPVQGVYADFERDREDCYEEKE